MWQLSLRLRWFYALHQSTGHLYSLQVPTALCSRSTIVGRRLTRVSSFFQHLRSQSFMRSLAICSQEFGLFLSNGQVYEIRERLFFPIAPL